MSIEIPKWIPNLNVCTLHKYPKGGNNHRIGKKIHTFKCQISNYSIYVKVWTAFYYEFKHKVCYITLKQKSF